MAPMEYTKSLASAKEKRKRERELRIEQELEKMSKRVFSPVGLLVRIPVDPFLPVMQG